MKEATRACANTNRVSVSVERTVIKGRISRDLNTLTVKAVIDFAGTARGERGDARYTFKTSGPSALPATR